MLKITIAGVPPYDGDYQLEKDTAYNGNELHLIKQFGGARLGEIDEAVQAFDYDVMLALATIALWRNGKADKRTAPLVAELLRDAEAGTVKFEPVAEDDEGEGDAADPPAVIEPSDAASSKPSLVISEPSSEEPLETIPATSGALG